MDRNSKIFARATNLAFDTRWLTAAWILLVTACSVFGWVLSAVRALWLLPYAVLATSLCFIFFLGKGKWSGALRKTGIISGNPFALLFFLVSIIIFVGGALHPPNNYDALTYRFPRMLHWVAENGWHWITTPVMRMNIYATGSEWLTLPIFQVTGSDRLLFLPNFLSFLLLPGLVFGVFRALGVSGRVSRVWMWILPCSYGFALQAGSIGNDLLALPFLLGSIYFALRCAKNGSRLELSLAILAASLVTGMKATNLTLLLPCAIAFWPARKLVWKNPVVIIATGLVALLTSAAPIAYLNVRYTDRWTGDPQNLQRLELKDPVAGILGNTLQLIPQLVLPPVLPNSSQVERMFNEAIPLVVREKLAKDYQRFDARFGELPQEECASLGLGIFSLCLFPLFARLVFRRDAARFPRGFHLGHAVAIGAWIALAVYMAKAGSEATARLLLPYYPLLILPLLFHPVNSILLQKRWWRGFALLAAGSVLIPLILTPSRPLWPAKTVISELRQRYPASRALLRAEQVFSTYANRNDLLAPLRRHLPPEVNRIGLIVGEDDTEVALWRPFGQRRVIHLIGEEPWQTEIQNLEWIVGRVDLLEQRLGKNLESIAAESNLKLVAIEVFTSKVSGGPEKWFVLARN